MNIDRKKKNNRKIVAQVLGLISQRPLYLHYQYIVLTMLSLRYFHQFFTHADVLVREPKTNTPQYYRTTSEQFAVFTFYLIYDQARWSYMTQSHRQESLCVSLCNAAKDMQEFFPSLRSGDFHLYEIPPLDEILLMKMIQKIDQIDIPVGDADHKNEFVSLMQLVVDRGEK